MTLSSFPSHSEPSASDSFISLCAYPSPVRTTACTHLVRRRSLPFTKGRVADWRSQADGWGALPERAPTRLAADAASHPPPLRGGGISAQSPPVIGSGADVCIPQPVRRGGISAQ